MNLDALKDLPPEEEREALLALLRVTVDQYIHGLWQEGTRPDNIVEMVQLRKRVALALKVYP